MYLLHTYFSPLKSLAGTLLFAISITSATYASDHVDGEEVMNDAVIDISDLFAFVSPNNKNHLVVMLNTYPIAPASSHFAKDLVYSFVITPVSATGVGLKAGVEPSTKNFRIDCGIDAEHDNNEHKMICMLPNKQKITSRTNNRVVEKQSGALLFAGTVSDPFLVNAGWLSKVVFDQQIPPADASNDLGSLNVLSIVIEIDIQQILGDKLPSLLAISGEVSRRADGLARLELLDRVGRPEFGNVYLTANSDQVDLRDQYNKETPFSMNNNNKQKYLERVVQNISYLDSLDKSVDWPDEWKNTLAKLLVDDYLLVDISKSFSEQGYFNIEYALLRSQPITRSGGRVPGDNVINTLVTLGINQGLGSAVTNGIKPDSGLPIKTFPYLKESSGGFFSWVKSYFARKAIRKIALKKREEKITRDMLSE